MHAYFFAYRYRLLISFANNFNPDQALQNVGSDLANSLDPDQARHNVGPDLDSNCLTL